LTGSHRHDSLAGLFPRTIAVVSWLAFLATAEARAAEPDAESPETAAPPGLKPAEVDAFLAAYAPPPVEGPALRLPYTPTRLYLDASYGRVNDLSSLPIVQGAARNLRFAAGGSWRWRRFAFTGELPFLQVTSVDFTLIDNQPPPAADVHQTAASIGDLRVGVEWTDHLTDAIVGGFGFRARLPTHTTRFTFHLTSGTADYPLPYYFHLEPTAILGAAVGRFTFVVNQGAAVLAGPSGDFQGVHIEQPMIALWDAAYAVSWAPLDELGASLELSTDIQLNHIGGLDFTRLNDLRAVSLVPALQGHVAGCRVDLVARFGLSKGATPVGILEYAGSTSYTLRVTRPF
jgi:hypothetical protein